MSLPQKKQDFDLEVVLANFRKCHLDPAALLLQPYVLAFEELCRFFKLAGTLFSFVASDLQSKIDILKKHMAGPQGQHYTSIQSMVEYEVSNNLTTALQGGLKSGSRTLLRLHRALEFIVEFMSQLSECEPHTPVPPIAIQVYDVTLGQHHPWILRQMAHLAIRFLPTRQQLINIMCRQDEAAVVQLLQQVVQEGRVIDDVTGQLYDTHQLKTLP